MKKFALIVVLVAVVGAFPAHAVTYGTLDGKTHPYVGLVRLFDGAGNAWRCSGTLLSSTVVLTAGHCTKGATSARVWFDAAIPDLGSGGTAGTPYTHPQFTTVSFTAPDIGVVVLSKPVKMSKYGALPTAGLVATIGSGSTLHTVVGYGLQEVKPNYTSQLARYRGTVKIQGVGGQLGDYVQISSNSTALWSGGTCAGDSGGPLFRGNTNVVLAITSGGANVNCKGASYDYRVDVAAARTFLSAFLKVP